MFIMQLSTTMIQRIHTDLSGFKVLPRQYRRYIIVR